MKFTEEQIKKGLDKAYKESGDNAYFGNGFYAGVKFASNNIALSDYAKEKLEYINGSCIARDFPNEQPTKVWVGAVLDLLEELKLSNF